MRQFAYAVLLSVMFLGSAFAEIGGVPTKGRDIVDAWALKSMQAYMLEKRFDAWMFSGVGSFDDLQREFLGLSGSTRHRWILVIPGIGSIRKPFLIYHADDSAVFSGLSYLPLVYRSREEMTRYLTVNVYSIVRKVGLNYSPHFNIPDMDRTDAGLIGFLQENQFEVVSAGSMLSFFNTRWLAEHVESHARAAAGTDSVMRAAVGWLADRMLKGKKTTDGDLVREVEKDLKKRGLETVHPVVVRLDSLTLSEDYIPDPNNRRQINRGSLLYLEIAARQRKAEDAMYARLGWTMCVDTSVAEPYSSSWKQVVAAADTALWVLDFKLPAGKMLLGFQVDEAARAKLGGDPDALPRPLGFNLNAWGHHWGVQFDNFLSHDDREVMPGMGFTLEPALYRQKFAVRICDNLVINGERKVILSAPLQRRVIAVLAGPRALAEAFETP